MVIMKMDKEQNYSFIKVLQILFCMTKAALDYQQTPLFPDYNNMLFFSRQVLVCLQT